MMGGPYGTKEIGFMNDEKEYKPKASNFVIAGFFFTWAFGVLPGAMGAAASYSPAAGMWVVIGFGVLMTVVMAALARNQRE